MEQNTLKVSAMSQDELRSELKLARTKFNFDAKYRDLGGTTRLMEMVEAHAHIDEMSAHFPVSGSRISQILEVLLGMPYSVWLAKQGVRRKKVPNDEV